MDYLGALGLSGVRNASDGRFLGQGIDYLTNRTL